MSPITCAARLNPLVLLLILIALSCRSSDSSDIMPEAAMTTRVVAAELDHDRDSDGISDSQEASLAERYAPIIYHAYEEKFFPMSVESFLQHTTLMFYDDACTPDENRVVDMSPTSAELPQVTAGSSCGSTDVIYSGATRSRRKQRTFYLADVSPQFRTGGSTADQWPTYYHAYKNNFEGITIQFWRFYPFNGLIPYHGGDWEGVHIVLSASETPRAVRFLGHATIDEYAWDDVEKEGNHPVVYSERGGHASRHRGRRDGIRHDTWAQGGLVNLGEKTRPMKHFLQYSGLWGSPGVFYETSGYWGPAYNETQMRADGFITAWCADYMIDESREAHVRECYPAYQSR
jgi:hypothetical protein